MKTLLALLVALAGCYGAHRNSPDNGDDVPVCGDVTCDATPAATCVDDDTLRTFEAACGDGTCSYPSTDVECGGAGCCGDHCCAVTPSNASEIGELEATGLVVAPPNGTFDTSEECVETSALGKCTPITRTDLPEACVCRADELTIGSLRVTGKRALVLLVKKHVVVTTLLDVSGDPGVPGPGAAFKYSSATNSSLGGVGGSFATQGAGADGDNNVAAAYGEPTLVPLVGGMSGRAGGYTTGAGGGGGALQITAGERVEIAGVINAGGGGGRYGYASYPSSGGSGGGSGGAVLIEAPTVMIAGTIVANGGGGGGGGGDRGTGGTGTDGGSGGFPTADPSAVAGGGFGNDGGGCPLYGYVSGGDGGRGATGTQAPGYGSYSDYDNRCLDTAFVGGGGGGGGVGRIRINTTTGCQCGGTISPSATFGMLVKQ